MVTWTKEETLKLIELWSYEYIQVQLEGCKQNQQFYENIASLMRKEGFTTVQTEKIKKLHKQYKKVKDKIHQTEQQG